MAARYSGSKYVALPPAVEEASCYHDRAQAVVRDDDPQRAPNMGTP
jgi:hypothetical protein